MASIMSPRTLLIAAAALAASTVLPTLSASAEDATPSPQTTQTLPMPLRATIMFNLIDRNSDGSLDQDEIAALQKAIFSAIDKDGDGKLSKQEFASLEQGPGMRGPHMGPGRMGRGMMDGRGFGPGFFHRGGPDGQQGQIDDQQLPGGPQGQPMQFGDNQDGTPPPPDSGAQLQDFASLDKNGDGAISADEFASGNAGLPGPALVR